MAKVWRWAGCYPPQCWQGRWEGRRKGFKGRLLPNVAFASQMAAGPALGKRSADGQSMALGSRKAAKGAAKGTGKGLKAGYCLTLLSETEATRKLL